MTNCSLCPPLPSVTTTTTLPPTHPIPFLPYPLSPIWSPPTKWKHNKNTLAPLLSLWFATVCPSTIFFLPPHLRLSLIPPLSRCLNPLLLLLFSLHSLRPSCLSFLHGTVAFLWTSLPVACGHVPTPLHCPPLRSVSFPLSPVPSPLWPPAPLLPLLSLKSVTPHCLFILFGTLSSFHLLFYYYCYLARWACLVSCCWLCVFLTTDGLSSGYRAMMGWGLYDLFWLLWVCVREVRWEHTTQSGSISFNFEQPWFTVHGQKTFSVFHLQREQPLNRNIAPLNRNVCSILFGNEAGSRSKF